MTSSIVDSLLCTMQGKTLAQRRRYARCSPWGSAVVLQMAPAEGVAQHIPAGFARIETGVRQALRARRCRVWREERDRCGVSAWTSLSKLDYAPGLAAG